MLVSHKHRIQSGTTNEDAGMYYVALVDVKTNNNVVSVRPHSTAFRNCFSTQLILISVLSIY